MKRRIISIILTLSMALSMLSVTAWAAETEPDETTEAAVSSDAVEPLETTAEDAAPSDGAGVPEATAENSVPSNGDAEAPETAAEQVQALIDALPSVDEIRATDTDSQRAAYNQTQTAYDAYQALTDEQRGNITGAELFEELFAFFNGQTMLLVNVNYVDGNTIKSASATAVTSGSTTWSEGWYVVNSNITISSRITVSDTVNLILADGCTLTASSGVQVASGNTLVIWGQSGGTGTLTAAAGDGNAGIGGNSATAGTITINGGTVNATGGSNGAGIGGSKNGNGGTITINGGTVNATGGTSGAGIGGGHRGSKSGAGGSGGTITINGGTVTATASPSTGDPAGIGAGGYGPAGNITINGGIIIAKGSNTGIDSGAEISNNGRIAIYGGTVITNGLGWGQYGTSTATTISGGVVICTNEHGINTSAQASWGGFIYDTNYGGRFYGITSAEIPVDVTLAWSITIESGQTLKVTNNAVLAHTGTIRGSGTIDLSKGSLFSTGTIDSTITITPSTAYTVTAPTAKTGLVYNPSGQQLVNAGSISKSGARIEYSLDDVAYSSSIPTGTNVGSYSVYYKAVNFGNGYFRGLPSGRVNVSIGRADRALTITDTPGTVTYGDDPFTLGTSGGSDTGYVSWSIPSASKSYATIDSSGVVTVLNATSERITVTASKTRDTNYNEATATWEFTINKATPTYDTPSGLTVQYGRTLADVVLPARWKWVNENTGVGDVGQKLFPATFTPEDTNNYNIVNTNVPVEVIKSNSTVTATDTVAVTYGDTLNLSAQVSLATFAIGDNNDKVEFYLGGTKLGESTVSKSGGTAMLNTQVAASKGFQIGDNTVRAVYNGGLNLNGSEKNAITVKVSRKELTINGATAVERIYEPGNTQVEVTGGKLVGVVGAEDVQLVDTGALGKIASADAGTGKSVTVTGYTLDGDDKDHYTLKQPELVTVTITQATPEVEPPTAIEGLVYNGTPQELVKAGSTTGGELQYSTDNKSYSPNIPTGRGATVYTVYYKVVGNNNYKSVDAAGPIEVGIVKAGQDAPDVIIRYAPETLSTTTTMQYNKTDADDDGWTDCDADMPVTAEVFGWDGTETVTMYFRYAEDEDHNSGAVYMLEIPTRPDAPTGIAVTKAQTSVTLTCANAEFAKDTPAGWRGGTFNGLTAGETYTFYIRTEATAETFASHNTEVTVITVSSDGSTTLQPGETVGTGSGGKITNNEDNVTLDDGRGNTTTVTPVPSGGAAVDENGDLVVPGGSTVTPPGGPEITVGAENGGTVDKNGNVTLPEGGSAKAGDATVTAPEGGGTLEPDGEGGVAVPEGSIVTPPGGPDVTLPEGGTVDANGNIIPEGDSVQIGDATVTAPEGGGTLEPDGKGGVAVPEDSTVTPPGGEPDIKVGPENGGTVDKDGNVTLPGGGSAGVGDATITAPGNGGTLKPDNRGNVFVPGGSTVMDGEGKKHTVPPQGGTISKDGTYKDNPVPSSGNSGNSVSSGGGFASTNPVTVSQAKHGKVTVRPSSASSGQIVTITVTPDAGYILSKLTVTDSRGNELILTDKGNGVYTFTMPFGGITVEALFVPWTGGETGTDSPASTFSPASAFSDLSPDAWYWNAVDYVIRNGLMNGYGYRDRTFGPNDTLSRAMLAQVLYNQTGRPGVNGNILLADASSGAWYTDAITWAATNEIIYGYGRGAYGPDDPVTREQLAVMLYRFEQSRCGGFAGEWTPDYPDTSEISEYALEAVAWCTVNGILGGYDDGALRPGGNATRAEAAVMLMRFMSL